jgi:hypothetical protein
MSQEVIQYLEDMEKLITKLRKDVINKLANTSPDKIKEEQFTAAVNSARHIAEDWTKLLKKLKHYIR